MTKDNKTEMITMNPMMDTEMTTTTTETSGGGRGNGSGSKPERSLVQRRRRKRDLLLHRYRREVSTSTEVVKPSSNNITLDFDEIRKLCRLVNLYRQQQIANPNSVSGSIYLYRIDPKVLQSPLEEVNIAFGSRQKNWLIGFDEKLMSLWGSFVRMG